ncbi:hypothetical protein D3C81_1698720 [compost metagenome]
MTVERFDVHEFGASVEMVMASAHDAEVERLKQKILQLELKVSDQYIETCADTVLLGRVIAENTHLRSDIDALGDVLGSSIAIAARYLDDHKAFRRRVMKLSETHHDLGDLRDALIKAVNEEH